MINNVVKISGFASGKREFERKCSCLMDRIGLICQTVSYFMYGQKPALIYALCVTHESVVEKVTIPRMKYSPTKKWKRQLTWTESAAQQCSGKRSRYKKPTM